MIRKERNREFNIQSSGKEIMSIITKEQREELFRQHADHYLLCFSSKCPLREHCLHALVNEYANKTNLVVTSVNLNNPKMQTEECPRYDSDEPIKMPVGIKPIYYDMPGRLEKLIKGRLIALFSRKRYYAYHNGTLPLTPDVEQQVRQTAKDAGWNEPLTFAGTVVDYVW